MATAESHDRPTLFTFNFVLLHIFRSILCCCIFFLISMIISFSNNAGNTDLLLKLVYLTSIQRVFCIYLPF